MSQEWYVKAESRTLGPLSAKQLRDLVAWGRVTPDTLVRCGDAAWMRAERVKGLFPGALAVSVPAGRTVEGPTATHAAMTDTADFTFDDPAEREQKAQIVFATVPPPRPVPTPPTPVPAPTPVAAPAPLSRRPNADHVDNDVPSYGGLRFYEAALVFIGVVTIPAAVIVLASPVGEGGASVKGPLVAAIIAGGISCFVGSAVVSAFVNAVLDIRLTRLATERMERTQQLERAGY